MRIPRLFLNTDTRFLVSLGLLVALGLIFLSSASAPLAYERFHNRSYYLWHQVLSGVIPGIIAFWFTARLRRTVLARAAIPAFLVSLVLLILLLIPGLAVTYGRTRSWLGLGPLTFQPAEIAKLGLILALAAWVTIRRPSWLHIRSWSFGLAPFLAVLGTVVGLIALQPDVGTMVIIAAIGIVMAFAAGTPLTQLVAVVIAGGAALGGLIAAAPYRIARLTVFLHPTLDPQGIGYQVNQALLAVGSGGWFGQGLGRSRQKFAFLPEVISDSIFAIIAEEIGFVFAVFFIGLIAYVTWRVIRDAFDATDAFDRLVLIGIAAWWGSQSLVNIGAMVGLLPITGLPLPFVSYGGTAMVVSLAAAGIVVNLSRKPTATSRKL